MKHMLTIRLLDTFTPGLYCVCPYDLSSSHDTYSVSDAVESFNEFILTDC